MTLRYLIDTTVIYSYTMRDIFITLATRGLPVHWSVQIEAEFIRARGRVSAEQAVKARRVVALMRRAVPDWEAVAGRTEIARLHLPDRDDRHVLAAAIQIGAQVIVTDNRRHFPAAALRHQAHESRSGLMRAVRRGPRGPDRCGRRDARPYARSTLRRRSLAPAPEGGGG